MRDNDLGHRLTDLELAKLEKRISSVYGETAKELQKTIDEYFDSFARRDKEMQDMIGTVQNGKEWTEADYKQWRLAQIGRGKRFEALRDKVAQRMTKANETAVSYVNDKTPGIYSLNRNYAAYTIEQVAGNADFTLLDEQTVKRLIAEDPDLMPYYPPKRAVNRGIDLAYGKRQISASVTSSILQGKSVKGIADDLQTRIPTMNRDSAIRTARTAVTGAQNAGRMNSYAAAQKMGIQLKREWLATLDNRTRHAHAMLDGQQAEMDKPFKVDGYEIMFPGDTSAPGYLVYNCRCTMIAAVDGVGTSDAKRRARDPETGESVLISNMSYQEWEAWKKSTNQVAQTPKSAIIEPKTAEDGGAAVQMVGRIDVKKYRVVSDKITTDEVIITDERIQHIKNRHPNDFERYSKYISDIVENPQYIIEANKPNTAFVLKKYIENEERFQLILRLAVEGDKPGYKNSVITFLKVEEKRFKRYLRTKKVLYKSE